ncbi:MAG: SiaB family protein kinase [Luteibaculaceae bacterium]
MSAISQFNLETTSYKSFVTDFYKAMNENQLALVYEGEINQDLTKIFANMAERNLEGSQESSATVKKMHHIVVECLQNISKHAEPKNSSGTGSRGVFMVRRLAEQYEVITGNLVENEMVDEISFLLNKVNSLDKDELKEFYKSVLKESVLSEKGGAGLGLIDIKKKTGNPIEFNFLPVENNYSFFTMISRINR